MTGPELIHAPTRLAIVSLLAAAQWADFKYRGAEVRAPSLSRAKRQLTPG